MYPIAPSRTYFAFALILLPRFVGWEMGSSGPESGRGQDVSNITLSPSTGVFDSPSRSLRNARFMPTIVSAISAAWVAMAEGLRRGSRFRHAGKRVQRGVLEVGNWESSKCKEKVTKQPNGYGQNQGLRRTAHTTERNGHEVTKLAERAADGRSPLTVLGRRMIRAAHVTSPLSTVYILTPNTSLTIIFEEYEFAACIGARG